MSSKELIESLRKAGEENLRLLRKNAEQEAEAAGTAAAEKLSALRKRYADELADATGEEARRGLAEAAGRARAIRLASEKVLADRLFQAARASLERLRNDGHPAVFEQLALELPALPWKIVRVNPADVEPARKHLPFAEIVPVESISGGLDAAVADGTIRVINTFEKRLEQLWADLLPLLIKDVYQEISDGSSQKPR
jgi:vacuolar-type H+-ATPase subunit E/Vma4